MKKKIKINEKMTFAELIERDSEAANKLAEQGLFCGGCPMAQLETIADGARAHGMDPKKLVERLNKKSSKKNKKRK